MSIFYLYLSLESLNLYFIPRSETGMEYLYIEEFFYSYMIPSCFPELVSQVF